jgi:hypothetical protein
LAAQALPAMGFDQNDPKPVLVPAKRTTKVNIIMVAAVILFFIICLVAVMYMHRMHD